MKFEHTEDRRMIADSLGRYLRDNYAFETRDQIAQSGQGFSREHWNQFAQLGIVGALFPESRGGYGGDPFDIAVIFEELGRALVVEPFLPVVLAGSLVARLGRPGQLDLLQAVIQGERIAALAHYEPQSRYQLSDVQVTAQQHEGCWVLNGAKAVVWQAEAADFFVVSARTSGMPQDQHGISLFLVPASASGLSLRGYPLIDGGRGAELILTEVRLQADALLGTQDAAYADLEHAIATGVLALTAESLGAMQTAKDMTLQYLRERTQFGVPIGSFQALQHRMADILLEIEQARSAVINAAAALQSDDRVTRERAVSAAKYTVGRVGTLVAEESIQMHGGIGMSWELPLPHYAKRLIMIDHQLGDEDFHLGRYMALAAEQS
jgi:hypothetical protein